MWAINICFQSIRSFESIMEDVCVAFVLLQEAPSGFLYLIQCFTAEENGSLHCLHSALDRRVNETVSPSGNISLVVPTKPVEKSAMEIIINNQLCCSKQ